MNQLPNLISIFRTILAIGLAVIVLDNSYDNNLLYYSFWITWIVIILDGVDGIIARALKSESDFGAFFDIACDRVVELIYISLFVVLKWIPFWVLIIFLVRGVLVDGIRGFALKEGKTAFGKKSMMKTTIGYFLTSSRFMRFSYGLIKAIAFAFMFLVHSYYPQYLKLESILVYLMTFYCLVRGIPVLIEGKKFYK